MKIIIVLILLISFIKNKMPVYCTKRIISYTLRPRLFCIFDQHLPYEMKLKYKRQVPYTNGGSGVGFSVGNVHITDIENVSFIKYKVIRVENKKEAQKVWNNLRNGNCFYCERTQNCKYINQF